MKKSILKKLLLLLLVTTTLLLFQNCSKDHVNEIIEPTINQPLIEEIFPGYIGEITTINYHGIDIRVMNHGKDYIFQGDVIITQDDLDNDNELQSKETSAVDYKYKWTNKIVYYTLNSNLNNQYRVIDAIAHLESNSELTFIQRTTQLNYIEFISSTDPYKCGSNSIGMKGGKQTITLGEYCSTGNTIHEIGHAIGLYHEQSRSDRDNYVVIHGNDIISGLEYNFAKYTSPTGKDIGSFDFGSIMMYGPYSFTSTGNPTITKIDGSTYSYQRTALSAGDIAGIEFLYPIPPLSVYISGPIFGNNTSTYTWTAHPSNGKLPYTYVWKRSSNQGGTYPYSWGNGTSSYTVQMPLDQDLYIKVMVTDANGISVEDYFVTENSVSGGHKGF